MKKTGKKLLVISLVLSIVISALSLGSYAAPNATDVFVTISDASGTLALVNAAVSATDIDSDGKITINDALYAAHEAKYTGGAAAGYAYSNTSYGISLDKLWGVANGGSYGYYVNNAMPLSLADEVHTGDSIMAYIFTDTAGFSDVYSYFNVSSVSAKPGESFTLTLSYIAFDASWNPVATPVEGAVITVDGTDTSFVTAADGTVSITVASEKTALISAKSSSQTLVPPACVASVYNSPNTGCECSELYIAAFSALLFAAAFAGAFAVYMLKVKKANEN